MKVVEVSIKKLKCEPKRTRVQNERSISAIARSLEEFGQQKPIVVGRGNIIIAGNGVLEAAKELGWKTILAVRTNLTGLPAGAYSVADNRTAELSEWDWPVLTQLLSDVRNCADLDELVVSFDTVEIDRLISQFGSRESADFEPLSGPDTRLDKLNVITCPACGHEFTH